MGRQSKLKKIASASGLFLSANASDGIGNSQGTRPSDQPLEISLIHLVLDVLPKVKVGDAVSVDVQGSPFRVFTAKGAVGDIPARFETTIRQRYLFSGSIVELRLLPPGLRIKL